MLPVRHVNGRPAWVHKKLYGASGDRLSGSSLWHTTGGTFADDVGGALLKAAVRGPAVLAGPATVWGGAPPPGAAGLLGGVPVDRPPPAVWPGGNLGCRAAGGCLRPCPAVRKPARTRAARASTDSAQPHIFFLVREPSAIETSVSTGHQYRGTEVW